MRPTELQFYNSSWAVSLQVSCSPDHLVCSSWSATKRFIIYFSEPKDCVPIEEKPSQPTPGRLVAEPYSWKSLVTGQPILRICTTGTKASVLTLPPGRHVLRFLLQAPHGYHVEMTSQTPFVYGDEDTVMACLTKVVTCMLLWQWPVSHTCYLHCWKTFHLLSLLRSRY